MRGLLVFVALVVVFRACSSRSVAEEASVVSVYTTHPTTAGTSSGLDVYHQIANNIAEKITSPIYRFLGIEHNKTDDQPLTKKPWEKIELLDELPEDVTKSAQPVDNDISDDRKRDIEELSVEALKKIDKKPEKVIFYSSYLPAKEKLERNDTINAIDDIDDDDTPFELDDMEPKARDGPFVYILEWISSIVQLAWGAFDAIFKPNNSNKSK